MKLSQLVTKVGLGILFAIAMQNANAQTEKGFYASIQSGYSHGTGYADLYQSAAFGIGNSNQISATTSTSELVAVNLGKGLNFGGILGYNFTKNIGFELGGNYLIGSKINSASTSYTGNYTNTETSAKMLQIMPSLVFRVGLDKIDPYAKVGMVIGVGKITTSLNDKRGSDITSEIFVLDGGTPIGFRASIGTLYRLNTKLSLFGELNLIGLEYAPKNGISTASTINGIDQLPTKTVQDKEIEFVESYTENGDPSNPNEPSKSPIVAFSFNSVGLNIGLQYHF